MLLTPYRLSKITWDVQKQNLSYEQLLMEKSFLRFCAISNEDRHIQNDKHVVKFNHFYLD